MKLELKENLTVAGTEIGEEREYQAGEKLELIAISELNVRLRDRLKRDVMVGIQEFRKVFGIYNPITTLEMLTSEESIPMEFSIFDMFVIAKEEEVSWAGKTRIATDLIHIPTGVEVPIWKEMLNERFVKAV